MATLHHRVSPHSPMLPVSFSTQRPSRTPRTPLVSCRWPGRRALRSLLLHSLCATDIASLRSPEVLVTPTQDIGKILTALHTLKISGDADITTGIQIAQLALKHRQNKNQRQRIVVFVGSPLTTDDKTLVKLGKKLKKNNIAIDVVSFGEGEENDERLRAFVESVSSSDNRCVRSSLFRSGPILKYMSSHLVSIPAGPHLLSDMIISSPILAADRGGSGGDDDDVPGAAGGSGGNDFEFGVDPSLDPELAMVRRYPESRCVVNN